MLARIQRNVAGGILTIIPILLTLWIIGLLFRWLIGFGRPLLIALARCVGPHSPTLGHRLEASGSESALALLVVFTALYVLGGISRARAPGRF
jgi:uncharacterized membrane protein